MTINAGSLCALDRLDYRGRWACAELTPATYQIRFGKVTKALEEDTMVAGTLEFEKLKSAKINVAVEQDDTASPETQLEQ